DEKSPTPLMPDTTPASRPEVYVAKAKNLLTGLPPTDDELARTAADPAALGALVDDWMKLPSYTAKMRVFFELAFQQAQIGIDSFSDQATPRKLDPSPFTNTMLVANAKESFARTALALIDEGHPFTETMTTRRFMVTPGLLELYAFLDTWHVDDDAHVMDRL